MIKRLLNQGWTVQAGDGGGLSALFGGPGEPPKPVNLPHDHLVEIPRNPQEPNGPGNGFFHEEDASGWNSKRYTRMHLSM